MNSSVTPYKNQSYSELKQQCKEARKLFEDPEFPASDASLFYQIPPGGSVVWKRPKEISDDPHLFVEGVSRQDLNQGKLGNCWFVAACSCLALRPTMWKRVIPNWEEQEWVPDHPENYAGIFHFRFWIFGQWVDVVVDDRLPTIRGNLVYCHSKQRNEFWSALLEKAYAKLSGCYESLRGGNTGDAVVDFSGAVAESMDLVKLKCASDPQERARLFEYLLKVNDRGGIISCSIKACTSETVNRLSCGLVKGHAYSVTDIRKMRDPVRAEELTMIRMRNPWGRKEWNGAWSDSSEEWARLSCSEASESMEFVVEDDGEFWMAFEDWCQNFTHADLCHVILTSPSTAEQAWKEVVHFGRWTKDPVPLLNRCGGSMETFLQNPQYLFEIKQEEDEVLVSLQQRDMRIHRPAGQGENLTIGFLILKVELNRKYGIHDLTRQTVARSNYRNVRTVFMRKILHKGHYIIVPSTYKPEVLGDFLLRVFTELDSGCRPLVSYQSVTEIEVRETGEGLWNQDSSEGDWTSVKDTVHTHPMKRIPL